MANFGIFIRSFQDDITIIDKCKNLLKTIQSDAKILHALRDDAHGGLKVVFGTDSIVAQLLQRKDLDFTSTIHALTTALIVHEAFPNNEEEFKNSIRNKMAAKVLDIKKVPLSAKYPEIGTGKWIIVLDVPEVEDLDEFRAMGLPSNMFLDLPNNNNKLRVEFYCRLCQTGGHVQSGCSDAYNPSSTNLGQNVLPIIPSPSKKSVHFPGTSSTNAIPTGRLKQKMSPKIVTPPKPIQPGCFRIRDMAEERSQSVLKSPAVKRDIKAFKVELGTEEVKRSLNTLMEIKKEKHDAEEVQRSLNTLLEVKKDKYHGEVYTPPAQSNFNVHGEFSENRDKKGNVLAFPSLGGCSSAAASSTSKDGLEIIYESAAGSRPGYTQNPPEIENLVTTSNLKRRLSDDDDSNPQVRKTLRMLPVVIPDGIRHIISGIPDQVVNIKQLEAFFSHVKKKSRPLEIAEMYTRDVKGFKKQLVEISRQYYMSPNVGSNADIQFVKMLQNVLKRFENAPPTPKRAPVSMAPQFGFQQSL